MEIKVKERKKKKFNIEEGRKFYGRGAETSVVKAGDGRIIILQFDELRLITRCKIIDTEEDRIDLERVHKKWYGDVLLQYIYGHTSGEISREGYNKREKMFNDRMVKLLN